MSFRKNVKDFVKENKAPLILIGSGVALLGLAVVYHKTMIENVKIPLQPDDSVWFETRDGMFIIHDSTVTPPPFVL